MSHFVVKPFNTSIHVCVYPNTHVYYKNHKILVLMLFSFSWTNWKGGEFSRCYINVCWKLFIF